MLLAVLDTTREDATVLLARVFGEAIAERLDLKVNGVGHLLRRQADHVGCLVIGAVVQIFEDEAVRGLPLLSVFLLAFLDRGRALHGTCVTKVLGHDVPVGIEGVTDVGRAPTPGVQAQRDDRPGERVEEVDDDLCIGNRQKRDLRQGRRYQPIEVVDAALVDACAGPTRSRRRSETAGRERRLRRLSRHGTLHAFVNRGMQR